MHIEIIGILASIIVLISFLYSKEKHIRIVNITGAILFVIYGLSISAFSIWFLNGILIIVHFIKLRKIKK